MIAQSAIRTDKSVRPASQKLYRQATAWKVNVCIRSRFLPFACGIMIARGVIKTDNSARPASQ